MVGTSYENREQLRFHAQARGYFDGTLPALNAGTVAHALGGRTTRDVLQSYFGRFNYSFDEKRSEERRVGKECRCWWAAEDGRKISKDSGDGCGRVVGWETAVE